MNKLRELAEQLNIVNKDFGRANKIRSELSRRTTRSMLTGERNKLRGQLRKEIMRVEEELGRVSRMRKRRLHQNSK